MVDIERSGALTHDPHTNRPQLYQATQGAPNQHSNPPLAALDRDVTRPEPEYLPPSGDGKSGDGTDAFSLENGQGGHTLESHGLDYTGLSSRGHLDGRGWAFKALFIVTTCSAQLIAQGQFGMVVVPLYEVGRWLGTEEQGQLGWMAASYGLTVGMFLIMSGRLGDLYGPKRAWLIGYILVVAANIGSGFCRSPIPFNVCRALGGIGAAVSLPNAVAILGRTYPPGQMRSIVFAILGALAPVGFIVPGAFAAALADAGAVEWIWFATAIFAALCAISGYIVLPTDDPLPPPSERQFDYIGSVLLIAALGLFNFTWNQAPLVGWKTGYIIATLIISILLFVAFFLWEKRMGRAALIPRQVLVKRNLMVYLSLLLGWVSFGTFLFYTVLFIRNIREIHSALGVTAQMCAVGPTGVIAALVIPYLITRVPGNLIFLASMVAFLLGNIVMSVAPAESSYWQTIFPALILVISGPDLSFATGQLIVSNSVDREFQGIAGGIVSMITNYSMSIGLGLASTVEVYVAPDGPLLDGYRAAFYFATGLSCVAVLVVGIFVRMPAIVHLKE